jgi:hypothetical protein
MCTASVGSPSALNMGRQLRIPCMAASSEKATSARPQWCKKARARSPRERACARVQEHLSRLQSKKRWHRAQAGHRMTHAPSVVGLMHTLVGGSSRGGGNERTRLCTAWLSCTNLKVTQCSACGQVPRGVHVDVLEPKLLKSLATRLNSRVHHVGNVLDKHGVLEATRSGTKSHRFTLHTAAIGAVITVPSPA